MAVDWTSSGSLKAAGKSLEYACYGPCPADAPTLVLLHEGLGCAALWRAFPQQLVDATGMGVCAFSRAGYGNSDPVELPRPLDYMTREAAEVLPDVLSALGVQRCVLLGHSDGATISLIYAGSCIDQRVRGVVAMAPHFFTEPVGLAAIAEAKVAYESGDLKARMGKYHADPENAFRGWNDSWLHPDFVDWNVSDVIDYIRVPVLAIQGREDQYGTLAQIHELVERSYAPVDTLVLDACQHAPHLEQPERTLRGVQDYCARLERIDAL